jgi:hypothetical protein
MVQNKKTDFGQRRKDRLISKQATIRAVLPMRIRDVNVSNSRLTEGSYHIFKILKVQHFSDEESYFVLQDPLGYKVLMPAGFYSRYGFVAGQEVQCRVDRINCNGRMFLEPMHPCYKEGESYEFEVLGVGTQTGITGDDEHYITVKDILGCNWKVRVFSREAIDESTAKITCKLEKIKKGKLFLSLDQDKTPEGGLVNGKVYLFLILDEKINPSDGQKYFILEHETGGKQLLKKNYYLHYGLKKGQEIRCRVNKFTSEGFHFLEPENPWYKAGNEYEFRILEIHKLHFSDGTVQDVLLLDDPHSEPVKVFVNSDQTDQLAKKEKVMCRVTGFRKSRLELLII